MAPSTSEWCYGGLDPTMVGQRLYVGRNPPQRSHLNSISATRRTDLRDQAGTLYHSHGSELSEAGLVVPGETVLDQEDEEDEDVPIRLLSHFTIYDTRTHHIVHLDSLLDLEDGGECFAGAVGCVSVCHAPDESDSDTLGGPDTGPVGPVELTRILELNVHSVSEDPDSSVNVDPKIYIRTQFAWYILDLPSRQYMPIFSSFWIKHALAQLVICCVQDKPTLSYDEFVTLLRKGELSHLLDYNPIDILKRSIDEGDFYDDDNVSYISSVLTGLSKEKSLKPLFKKSPMLRRMCVTAGRTFAAIGKSRGPRIDMEKEVLAHKNPTFITSGVRRIAHNLFSQSFHHDRVSGTDNSKAGPHPHNSTRPQSHAERPDRIQWVKASEVVPNYYLSVIIDGARYNVGDTVAVEKGEDENSARYNNSLQDWSTNNLANSKWFAKICYMFEIGGQKMFHAQWYQHGAFTLLQETAHPQGLFLIEECDNLHLGCIYQKCHIQALSTTENESHYSPQKKWDLVSGLCYVSGQGHVAFVEPSTSKVKAALNVCSPHEQCYSCGVAKLNDRLERPKMISGGGIVLHGVEYHPLDFVYLNLSSSISEVYTLGQVQEFTLSTSGPSVTVKLLGRCASIKGGRNFKKGRNISQHKLYLTSMLYAGINVELIEGKFFVAHPHDLPELSKSWTDLEDHFLIEYSSRSEKVNHWNQLQALSSEQLSHCHSCYSKHIADLQKQASLLEKHGPLRGLELFSGAGGLSTGLDASGFVKTQWAVEFSPSAALSYEANHPETIVYNQCSNLLLHHAIETFHGHRPKPLSNLNLSKSHLLPSLPMPGEVDFIYGGPPCQGFSAMNHNKNPDDIRITLVCNMLSWVEFYKPKYFLLENVVGMTQFSLNSKQGKKSSEGKQIKMGVVKFILRTLVALGYQCHFKILYANQYGSPQGRPRVIFWGARRDVILPDFPIPSHTVHQHRLPQRINLTTGDVLLPTTRECDIDDKKIPHQCAPLKAPTVDHAIGDLPKFDWIDPHIRIKETKQDKREVQERVSQGIEQFDARLANRASRFPGYPDPTPYLTPPQNEYQEWIRRGVGRNVTYQYSSKFTPLVVERVVNIPLEPYVNCQELPKALSMGDKYWETVNGKRGTRIQSKYKSVYQRIDGKGAFFTALTRAMPQSKGGSILHPHQKRILTVRESARCQGFPDSHVFLSINSKPSAQISDQHRQIGNAVPVPLALALGRALGKAVIEQWKIEEAEEMAGRARSPEIGMQDPDQAGAQAGGNANVNTDGYGDGDHDAAVGPIEGGWFEGEEGEEDGGDEAERTGFVGAEDLDGVVDARGDEEVEDGDAEGLGEGEFGRWLRGHESSSHDRRVAATTHQHDPEPEADDHEFKEEEEEEAMVEDEEEDDQQLVVGEPDSNSDDQSMEY